MYLACIYLVMELILNVLQKVKFVFRIFNPSENILKADNWHPLHKTNWLMPLLADLSHWRQKMKDTFNEVVAKESRATVTFFADFPGWFKR